MSTPSAELQRVELPIEGMTCASCAARVERGLNRLDGVSATVNFATECATVEYDALQVDRERLVGAVEQLGYHAALPDAAQPPGTEADPTRSLRRRVVVAGALSAPVLLVSMVPALQFDRWQWVALLLSTPVVAWCGWPFHSAAWRALRHGTATMDTLISLGTLAAWGWSVVALFVLGAGEPGMTMPFELVIDRDAAAEQVYFEVAGVVTTFILAGRYLEARAKRRAGEALRALLELAVKDVAVLDGDVERRIPVERLRAGDVFVVRPGEKVAADGVVVDGRSAVDQSLVTGESVPVEVGPGDEVVGATINAGGRLLVRATRVGDDTMLAQIARLVTEAQSGKAPVQRLADRISAVFVPIVIALSLATLGFWLADGASATFAFSAAVAALIIACPCALGLATPTALLAGTGRGAQMGIVIKGPEILESTRRVDTVVLDKTGTVTTGEMSLVAIHVADGAAEEDVLRLVGALEAASEHPIARAIARAAETRFGTLPSPTGFVNREGLGVEGTVEGVAITVGRPALLERAGIVPASALDAARRAAEDAGNTVVAAGWDGRARALLVVADTVKPTSAEAVLRLRGLELEPVLLTGDNEPTARAVAAAVGIDEVTAQVLPAEKVAVVRALQADGRVVAMVGDGVNDAPALAQADLGLAVGTGADVALEASDLTLVSGDLRRVADAIALSRRTLGTIKGNLFWAFAYNVAALPLAALGFLNPIVAGIAMACSSLFVVGNSLRLRAARLC